VRTDGVPAELPAAAEFDTRGPHLGATYEAAWLACQVLARKSGGSAVVELYEQVSSGGTLAGELRRLFGWTEADLVRAWQGTLAEL
jgi:hypothetical protein